MHTIPKLPCSWAGKHVWDTWTFHGTLVSQSSWSMTCGVVRYTLPPRSNRPDLTGHPKSNCKFISLLYRTDLIVCDWAQSMTPTRLQHAFSQQLLHRLLFLSALLCLAGTQQDGASPLGGLFPPITFTTNFASMTDVNATSTCSQRLPCTGGANCAATSCNDTCPFGQELPSMFSLLEAGVLSAGVMRVSWLLDPCQFGTLSQSWVGLGLRKMQYVAVMNNCKFTWSFDKARTFY